MTILFISDLHLDETRPDVTRSFYYFLKDKAVDVDALYILGDFFEVWLGDDHETEFNQEIITALDRLDIPLFLMHGNRDFLLGQQFCQQTGATLLDDPTVIDIDGDSVLLMHGDSLCTRDERYMHVRQQLRDENFQRDFLSKTIPERQAIANSIRSESQELTRQAASDIMDVTPLEVENVMRAHGVRTMIHGHTHRPKVHDLTLDGVAAQRIVLGDWDALGWYLTSTDGDLKLTSFEIR
ncbi:MAG: UDP-2,3-diacylglucosamine diphosphatase [bacterium]|nr:UDP-2,3-diacylglucosamine diphosphatase [Gammaproteobacteria bacterium]HIL98143.1 UDP-2,3-diacylglucosamine diphosphatase [Pseudomonadales bacterium]